MTLLISKITMKLSQSSLGVNKPRVHGISQHNQALCALDYVLYPDVNK